MFVGIWNYFSFKTPRILLLAVFILSILSVFGQKNVSDSAIMLKTFNVNSTRLDNFAVGATIRTIDSIDMSVNRLNSLSDLLKSASNVTVNSYGVGGLSSVSLRGGGSSHTAVVWNGLNIQSPMNSGVNFAVFPVSLFDNIKIQSGGSGTLFGSGAVSGIVHISSENLIQQENNVSVALNKGSFNDNSAGISLKQGGKNIATSIKAYYQKADNDFTYENVAKFMSPIEKQSHAGMSQYSAVEENQIRFSEHAFLNASFLLSHFDKDMQTQMIQSENIANQKDNNLMGSLNWKYIQPKYSFSAKSGYIYNQTLYADKNYSAITTDNHSASFINEIESKIKLFKEHMLNIGVNYTIDKGYSDSYTGIIERNRISLFTSYKLKAFRERLSLAISGRSEYSDNVKPVFVYSLGSEYILTKVITIKGNFSKNYRTPGFNDLYWNQGTFAKGNPNLNPESGYTSELGLEETYSNRRFSITSSQTGFNTYINDWIVWLPDASNVWTPTNKETGKTYGAEANIKASYHWKKASVLFNSQYTWTHSRIQSSDEYNDQPMIYVPEHSLMFSLTGMYKKFFVRYITNYYSERYYDYTHTLEAYQLVDLVFGYEKQFQTVKTSLTFKILNIWDTNYQAMAWYAMPRCHYMATLTVNILTKNNKKQTL